MFPETGKFSRDKYPKQLQFFKSTSKYKEIVFQAANRTGKTEAGAYAVTCWLTGLYPEWWEGKTFPGPTDIWACCVTNKLIGEVLNEKLLGKPGQLGTGMIPKDFILDVKTMPGVPDTYVTAKIKHVSGGISYITFKSYEQDREAYQGTARHVVWFDEEPPSKIYSEALTRTAVLPEGGSGIVMLTFTPLKGLSDVVLSFMPNGRVPDKFEGHKVLINATWEDVPHIEKEEQQRLLSSYSPYEAEARSKGVPQLGSGAIYPIPEKMITVDPFKIPDYWPRWYAGDCGVNHTAVAFFARDPNTDTVYINDEYMQGKVELPIHVAAINNKGGRWMNGVMDAADVATVDGRRWVQLYSDAGLNIRLPDKSKGTVEAGIQVVWQALSTGRLKVFSTCVKWLEEFRLYRRDEDGKIVKERDHLMDSTRYGMYIGTALESTFDEHDLYDDEALSYINSDSTGRNKITGY